MRDDVAKQIRRRKRRVEMGRIHVAGHRHEEIDIVSPNDPHQRDGIAYVQFIERQVPEN